MLRIFRTCCCGGNQPAESPDNTGNTGNTGTRVVITIRVTGRHRRFIEADWHPRSQNCLERLFRSQVYERRITHKSSLNRPSTPTAFRSAEKDETKRTQHKVAFRGDRTVCLTGSNDMILQSLPNPPSPEIHRSHNQISPEPKSSPVPGFSAGTGLVAIVSEPGDQSDNESNASQVAPEPGDQDMLPGYTTSNNSSHFNPSLNYTGEDQLSPLNTAMNKEARQPYRPAQLPLPSNKEYRLPSRTRIRSRHRHRHSSAHSQTQLPSARSYNTLFLSPWRGGEISASISQDQLHQRSFSQELLQHSMFSAGMADTSPHKHRLVRSIKPRMAASSLDLGNPDYDHLAKSYKRQSSYTPSGDSSRRWSGHNSNESSVPSPSSPSAQSGSTAFVIRDGQSYRLSLL